jgi:NADPH2:quinone reductase
MGYPAGTELSIDSLVLIWNAQGAGGSTSVEGFNIYFQPPEAYADAWATVLPLLSEGKVKPVIDRTYPLEEAAEATRHLIEDRPFGKVVLTM